MGLGPRKAMSVAVRVLLATLALAACRGRGAAVPQTSTLLKESITLLGELLDAQVGLAAVPPREGRVVPMGSARAALSQRKVLSVRHRDRALPGSKSGRTDGWVCVCAHTCQDGPVLVVSRA